MKLKINRKTALYIVGSTAVAAAAFFIVRRIRRDSNDRAIRDIANGADPSTVTETKSKSGKTKENPYPIGYGDRGQGVSLLQQGLNKVFGAGLDVDGIFGKKTLAALKQYMGIESLTKADASALYKKYVEVTHKTNTGKTAQPGTVTLPDIFI